MALSLDAKRDVITKNKDPAIAALQTVLDTYYNLIAVGTNSDGDIDPTLFTDEKAYKTALEVQADIDKFESVLNHLKDDKELSKIEVAYVGVAFLFCSERAGNQIASMTKAKTLCDSLVAQILEPEEKQNPIVQTSLEKEES